MKHWTYAPLILGLLATAACKPDPLDAEELLKNIDQHVGKRVVVKAKFKSGARCKLEEGEWKTYCKDCQYCRGPLVIDTDLDLERTGLDDWPLVLGGTYEGKDIRCKGKLNEVKCYPFEPGRTYVVQGLIEASHPPKLIVQEYWEDEG